MVRIIKCEFLKALIFKLDLFTRVGLLANGQNLTQLNSTFSPEKLLMGKNIKNILPVHDKRLRIFLMEWKYAFGRTKKNEFRKLAEIDSRIVQFFFKFVSNITNKIVLLVRRNQLLLVEVHKEEGKCLKKKL